MNSNFNPGHLNIPAFSFANDELPMVEFRQGQTELHIDNRGDPDAGTYCDVRGYTALEELFLGGAIVSKETVETLIAENRNSLTRLCLLGGSLKTDNVKHIFLPKPRLGD